MLGATLGIDQSGISRLIQKMLHLIEKAADPDLVSFLETAKAQCEERVNNIEQLWQKFPDLKDISTDATEQQCFRSKDKKIQKNYYSGKSKQHTIKTQISVASTGRIVDVTSSYPGSVHDKTIIDQEKTIEKLDKRVPHRFDSGYQGVRTDHPEHNTILPTKKPKNGQLTDLQKELNKYNSKRRVVAEHALSRAKKFRILAVTFRQPLKTYNQAFRNIVSILNFKLQNPIQLM